MGRTIRISSSVSATNPNRSEKVLAWASIWLRWVIERLKELLAVPIGRDDRCFFHQTVFILWDHTRLAKSELVFVYLLKFHETNTRLLQTLTDRTGLGRCETRGRQTGSPARSRRGTPTGSAAD